MVEGRPRAERELVLRAQEGAWIPGGHDVFVPGTTPRLAGNVLVWERGAVTYRLEGRFLTKAAALELARSLRHD